MATEALTPREREELALIEAQRVFYADQREYMRKQTEQMLQQMRWEPWKALAAFLASGAVFLGLVWAVATWESHRPNVTQVTISSVPPLTVHLEPK